MEIKEIVVISGKGGTGENYNYIFINTIFLQDIVIGDCDVDAPNLQILFNPQNSKKESFYGIKKLS